MVMGGSGSHASKKRSAFVGKAAPPQSPITKAPAEKSTLRVRERKPTEAALMATAEAATSAAGAPKNCRGANRVGLDALDKSEVNAIAVGTQIKPETMRKIFGIDNPLVHPKFNSSEECKSMQKWNPNGFGGLGFKASKKVKAQQFASSLARSDEVPFGGLKNLGATCYMNSMLQCLFHTRRFRNGVFQLAEPSVMTEEMKQRMQPICQLQNLFANLKCSKERMYDPAPFAQSLRISTSVQQDAQEFLKLLLTYMEDNLTLLPIETHQHLKTLIQDNYRGVYAYCTKCLDCSNVSKMEVSFYDLDLNVKGLSSLDECLSDFFKKEELVGENQYFCSKCEQKRDAERGIQLLELPKVLHLQLLRFVWDYDRNARIKVANAITFPRTLDLTDHCQKLKKDEGEAGGSDEGKSSKGTGLAGADSGSGSLAGGGDKGGEGKAGIKRRKGTSGSAQTEHVGAGGGCESVGRVLYDLESVVLHSGTKASEGHYIAYVKDNEQGVWWSFDDGHVSSLKDDDFFGTEDAVAKACKKRKASNGEELKGGIKSKEAYMLIYKRREECSESEVDVPVPGELSDPIIEASERVVESLKAERTAHDLEAQKKADGDSLREDIFNLLPCSEKDEGYWISTDWLREWLAADCGVEGSITAVRTSEIATALLMADPSKVTEMKRVSNAAWEKLASNYGIADDHPTIPCASMCKDTVSALCEERMKKERSKEQHSQIKVLLQSAQDLGDKSRWVSKRVCKEAAQGKLADASADPRGRDIFCTPSEAHPDTDVDRKLTPETSMRKLISGEAFAVLKDIFPGIESFPGTEEPCPMCAKSAKKDAEKEIQSKRDRAELKKSLTNLYGDQRSLQLKSNKSYFLVVEQWVDKFRLYVENHTIDLTEVDNSPLLSQPTDGSEPMLIYDPLEFTVKLPPFSWVTDEEWNTILSRFGGGPTIRVTPKFSQGDTKSLQVLVNKVPSKSSSIFSGSLQGTTDPKIDSAGVEARKEQEHLLISRYEGGTITVAKQVVSAVGGVKMNGGSQNVAATGVGRAGERKLRQRRGEISLPVNSKDTIMQVKVEIYNMENFHFSPLEQILTFNGVELAENDKTLEDYNVPNGAQLMLRTKETDEEDLDGKSKTNDVDAGFHGTVLSGLTGFGSVSKLSQESDLTDPTREKVVPEEVDDKVEMTRTMEASASGKDGQRKKKK